MKNLWFFTLSSILLLATCDALMKKWVLGYNLVICIWHISYDIKKGMTTVMPWSYQNIQKPYYRIFVRTHYQASLRHTLIRPAIACQIIVTILNSYILSFCYTFSDALIKLSSCFVILYNSSIVIICWTVIFFSVDT